MSNRFRVITDVLGIFYASTLFGINLVQQNYWLVLIDCVLLIWWSYPVIKRNWRD